MKHPFLFFFLLILISSCGDQKIDTTKARQEMEAREIKRVSEGEIVEKALAIGNEITQELSLTKDSTSELHITSNTDSPYKVEFLNLADLQSYPGGGKRFQVYDAYAYNIENNMFGN